MRNIICFLAALFFYVNACCNPTDSIVKKPKLYHVNYPFAMALTAGLTISDLFAINSIKGKEGISDAELLFLNSKEQKDLMNPIDTWAIGQNASNRTLYQDISDYGLIPIYLLPCLLALNKNIRKDWADLLLIYVKGITITFTIYNFSFLGPTFQNRYRPITYYTEFSDETRKIGNNRNSFYSGHVASAAYSTFFMSKVYCDYHPDMKVATKYLVYIAATIPPLLIGYVRVKSLAHFPSDVAVGLIVGAVCGIGIPELHKFRCSKDLSFGTFLVPDGMGLNICWNLPDHHPFSSFK